MTKRLESVDLELFGVQHSFRYDPAVDHGVDVSGLSEIDAQIAVGRAILAEVTSLEVQLVGSAASSASVEITFSITYEGSVTVDLDDLEQYGITSGDELGDLVEQGEFYAVNDAIDRELENIDSSEADLSIDSVSLFDEDGNDFDEE